MSRARAQKPVVCLFQRHVFETKLVEEALSKIGDLLRIGFGEAGADIIARCDGTTDWLSRALAHSTAAFVDPLGSNMSNLGNVEVILPGQKGHSLSSP